MGSKDTIKYIVRRKLTHSFFILSICIIILIIYSCMDKSNIESDVFQKTLFYESSEMTSITNIVKGDFDADNCIEVGIFDQFSLHIINLGTGKIKKIINFNWTSGILQPEIIFSEKEQKYFIIAMSATSDIGLMNFDGRPVWNYNPDRDEIINKMISADLDKNGDLEFYVATNKGLVQLDMEGNKKWETDDWVDDIDVYKDGRTSSGSIVSIFNSEIKFRNYNGDLIKEIQSPVKATNIKSVSWPTVGHLLITSDKNISILDSEANIVFSYKLDKQIYAITESPVNIYHNTSPAFALVAKYSSTTGKSMFCIFQSDGVPIYKELLGITTGLLALKMEASMDEEILVGDGPGRVIKYRLK